MLVFMLVGAWRAWRGRRCSNCCFIVFTKLYSTALLNIVPTLFFSSAMRP